MSIIEQMEYQGFQATSLIQGEKARVKHTGQIVELKRVSKYGISLVSICSGDDYFISNKYLEPVLVLH